MELDQVLRKSQVDTQLAQLQGFSGPRPGAAIQALAKLQAKAGPPR
jgi:hypothetical protein